MSQLVIDCSVPRQRDRFAEHAPPPSPPIPRPPARTVPALVRDEDGGFTGEVVREDYR